MTIEDARTVLELMLTTAHTALCETERDAIKTVLAVLKQKSVEPILKREGRNKNYNDYCCPICDNEVVYEQNYCSECGVQFLWGGR